MKKTIMVTGASSGVGLALTEALIAQQHDVVMAVRDLARATTVRDALLAKHPHASLRLAQVDIGDLTSIRTLAEHDVAIDVLVNNAGIAFEPLRVSREGVALQFATNHLGHFLLTALLYERLASANDPRVVTVTSTLARRGAIDLDNLDGSRGFSSLRAYTDSKVANVLFGAELDRRLRAIRAPVKSILVHPGVPATAMQQKATGFIGIIARTMSALIGKPPAHGATAMLEAAIGHTAASGDIWQPGKRLGDPPRKDSPWPTMHDTTAAEHLWTRSETLAGQRFL